MTALFAMKRMILFGKNNKCVCIKKLLRSFSGVFLCLLKVLLKISISDTLFLKDNKMRNWIVTVFQLSLSAHPNR